MEISHYGHKHMMQTVKYVLKKFGEVEHWTFWSPSFSQIFHMEGAYI